MTYLRTLAGPPNRAVGLGLWLWVDGLMGRLARYAHPVAEQLCVRQTVETTANAA